MIKNNDALIKRPLYMEKLVSWLGHEDLVKIITGVRRCGKSVMFKLFQQHLTENGIADKEQVISINLEDISVTEKIGLKLNSAKKLESYKILLDYISDSIKSDKMYYVFIDEVQLLEDWQQAANAFRLKENVDLYLTGSNAYMFSSDLANSFGGRYVEIKMQPFSLMEYSDACKSDDTADAKLPQYFYEKYVRESGFPQTLSFNGNMEQISDYLMNTVYYNTVQKDIVHRFNVTDDGKLDKVTRYIFDNIGNETSLRGIERGLKSSGYKVSLPTLNTYIKGLIDSYLVYKCDRYDIKGKQYLDSNPKYYVCDIGLRTALLGRADTDAGHMLENIVYLELLRRGYRVSTGKVNVAFTKDENGKTQRKTIEVDFVASKAGGEIEYYQVALYVLDEKVFLREITPLEAIKDNYPKFILSMDYGSGETRGIKRLNVFDWLLEK